MKSLKQPLKIPAEEFNLQKSHIRSFIKPLWMVDMIRRCFKIYLL